MNAPVPLPPKPIPDADTQPFWDGVAQGELRVPRCSACGHWIWQPRPLCPRCRAGDPSWIVLSGAGRVASWTVLHPPVLPVWAEKLPFVLLLVELDDAPGVRMVGQLVDADGTLLQTDGTAEGIDFGVPVALRWREDEAGQILPAWTPAD